MIHIKWNPKYTPESFSMLEKKCDRFLVSSRIGRLFTSTTLCIIRTPYVGISFIPRIFISSHLLRISLYPRNGPSAMSLEMSFNPCSTLNAVLLRIRLSPSTTLRSIFLRISLPPCGPAGSVLLRMRCTPRSALGTILLGINVRHIPCPHIFSLGNLIHFKSPFLYMGCLPNRMPRIYAGHAEAKPTRLSRTHARTFQHTSHDDLAARPIASMSPS